MSAPWLAIVGIGEDGVLGPEAQQLVAGAGLVMGGARHLLLAAPHIRGQALAWPSPMAEAIPALLERRGMATAVLASGDPMWFGVGATLSRHVPAEELRVVPAVSSFALAAARLGWALQDVVCLSCCGRPVEAVLPHLHAGARLLVLSADGGTPAALVGVLQTRGFGASVVRVLESLGGPRERVRVGVAEDVGALNLVAIEVAGAPGLGLAPGLDDSLFAHDGQITKREIRALTLSALAPRPGELLWDVGAGSGSVGIEWMLRHPACRAVAVERHEVRAARIRLNADAFGVPALQVVQGEAPEALRALAPPDAVFLGGGAHVPGVIEAAWAALRPGGRLVANAIALRTEAVLGAARTRYGGTLMRVGIERLDSVGGMDAYRPAMTVTQWRADK